MWGFSQFKSKQASADGKNPFKGWWVVGGQDLGGEASVEFGIERYWKTYDESRELPYSFPQGVQHTEQEKVDA